MNSEIEAKFLDTNHNEIRTKLKELGAKLETPMRLMKRVVIHTPDMSAIGAFVRIRDEGHRTTITYKQFDANSIDSAKEYEVEVSDFENAINIFTKSGLIYDTYQESKRENWRLGDVEIMLDEWPWLRPFIEIEGTSEKSVRSLAAKLGFDWNSAVFGGVGHAYLGQYPHIGDAGIEEIHHNWPLIKFENPVPELLVVK